MTEQGSRCQIVRRRRLRWSLVVVCLGAVVAAGLYSKSSLAKANGVEAVSGVSASLVPGTTIAKRAPLSLVLTRSGPMGCVQQTPLVSKVEWETRLTYILPEGTFVKKGDVIAELDVSKLRDEYGREQVDVMRAEASLAAAEDAMVLQRIDNENLLAKAALSKDLADMKLEGYASAEYPFQVLNLERQIAAAADAMYSARERLDFTQRLMNKGFAQANELDRDRLSLQQAEQKHTNLVNSLKVLQEHTQKRTLTQLSTGATQADRSVERLKTLADARMLAREIQLSAMRRNLLRQKQQFRWASMMLEECVIRAPHDGQVVYAPQSGWRDEVGEGMKVRFLQTIATIPNREQMKVTVRVHETQRRLLRQGLPAIVRLDSDRSRELPGKVVAISQFPVSGLYPNYDLREYEVVVQLEPGVEGVAPGLTAKVDLIAAARTDALQVPFEAVAEVGHRYMAFVRQGETVVAREITLGERSEDHVEILDGINEGEVVVLDPRDRCSDVIAKLEQGQTQEETALAGLVAE